LKISPLLRVDSLVIVDWWLVIDVESRGRQQIANQKSIITNESEIKDQESKIHDY
jgi:hypothetical protein